MRACGPSVSTLLTHPQPLHAYTPQSTPGTLEGGFNVLAHSQARNWEIVVAMLTIVVGNLTFIYVSANFTSLILRLNNQLENYRTRLQGVDNYLARNRVSKEMRTAVKRHFTIAFSHGSDNDQALLEQMPHALRREVLKNIYLRTMRRVPLYFGCDTALINQVAELLRRVVRVGSSLQTAGSGFSV